MLLDPIRSVWDFSFYKSLPRKSLGAVTGYIAYLSVLFSFAFVAALYIYVRPVIADAVEWAAASVPTLTLTGGKLSSQLTAPVTVRHPKVPEAAIMIDTARTEPVTAGEMAEKKVAAYLTQNAAYLLTQSRLETYPFDKAASKQPLVIDASFYRTMGVALTRVLYPIAFVFTCVMFALWKHVAALIYSLPALALNSGMSLGLDFPSLYKVAAYAQTPVIVLQALALFLPQRVAHFGIVGFAIVCAYLWKALRAIQQDAQPAA
ncbi:MAG TPA: DUF1189 family protein [Elusimicrobiota bacterium]|jgi:hypothetical protein|nr:DUF1189 family protein [Elusimicrobiota bacterium]